MKPRHSHIFLSAILMASVVSLIGNVPAMSAAGKDTYAHKMEMGQLLYFNGDVDRAIKAFRRAADLNPKAFEPHLNLVNLYVQKGGDEALEQAAGECIEVLQRKPSNKEVHLILGNLLRTQAGNITDKDKMNAKLDEAMKEVQTAQEMGAPEALCENTVGLILLQKGDTDAALEHINKAIKKQSNFPDAHLVKAVLVFKQISKLEQDGDEKAQVKLDALKKEASKKMLADVLEELDTAIEQKEKNAEANNTKADILFATGDHKGALEHYHKAIDAEPRYAQAWAGIGNVEAQLINKDADKKDEHVKAARDAYEHAKRLKPNDKNMVYGLAVMLEKQGMVSEAISEFQNGLLLETDPMMKAQIVLHLQQLQKIGLGSVNTQLGGGLLGGSSESSGETATGLGTTNGGIGSNIFTGGALSTPFKNLIKIKEPKDKGAQ